MRRPFQPGNEVALSATFLRSLGTLSFGPNIASGVSTYDLGIGKLISIEFEWLATVQFPGRIWKGNVCNLVHRADIHLEAMQAEHNPYHPRGKPDNDLFGPLEY